MRIASIDILRALTMVLMIWINDFWTLSEVLKWLHHAAADEDYLGFSDVIFPLFLFIVGLSIPYTIEHRISKNESPLLIMKHILIRSGSLLLIGIYMVNYETIHHESVLIGKYWWGIFLASSVVLIWTNWKRSPVSSRWHLPLQVSGFFILLYLAISYKGGGTGTSWMTTQWWGILGLIGWAYLANALAFLLFRGNILLMALLWLSFNTLAVLHHSGMSIEAGGWLSYFSTIYTGTIPAFTCAGILSTLVFRYVSNKSEKKVLITLIVLGVLNIVFGLITRQYWGISKVLGTPSWLSICTGIGFFSFVLLYYLSDIKKKTKWARIFAPAGTATLTCYMIPYFIYPLREITHFRIPDMLNVGIFGLIGSAIFALLVVLFTGLLERRGYKLKL